MKKVFTSAACFVCLSSAVFAQQPQQKPAREGVLLLAHGGSAREWNEEVRHVADQADLTVPTEIAFGMATKSTMQAAIDRLVARGVTEIVAVPLFVSSHSSVIDSTAYLLGLRAEEPEDLKMFAMMDHGGGMSMDHGAMKHDAAAAEAEKPIHAPVPIHMASALDHHAIVADILRDRAASISKDPAHEVVILVAHGPVPEDENKLWLKDMGLLADQMRSQTHYADIESLTLRDDADDAVRDVATKQLRERVEAVSKSGKTALIVPLLLSYGGIEDGLRKRLEGLDYRMPTQALLPDKRIVSWVTETAQASEAEDSAKH
ncbi:MAG TPA: CbiX/SirB N-terminal domain-containing protein [Granulicella sp.]